MLPDAILVKGVNEFPTHHSWFTAVALEKVAGRQLTFVDAVDAAEGNPVIEGDRDGTGLLG